MGSGRHRNGGLGKDTLTSGAGADYFLFRKDFGKDVITDFSAGFLLERAKAAGAKVSRRQG
ncbi:MAG: hypothetical protein GDA52_06670 [Rhodobacteraceae bacterium]|nr:hypothetical protein [Paracoccaceae bacterium]